MAGRIVLFDASVLYAAPIRDLLLELALSGLFRAKWTERINDEWIRHLLRNRPDLTAPQLARTRALMQAHVRDCLVEDFEALIETLTLPDPEDRHVLAAAIKSHAEVIVTFNLTDFPAVTLAPYGIEASHPDAFLGALLDLDQAEVGAAGAPCASAPAAATTGCRRLSGGPGAQWVARHGRQPPRHAWAVIAHLSPLVAGLRTCGLA